MAQPLTADHQLAAKAIRLPIGMPGISASPYLSLTELIHKWPASAAAREVLMVSSGIDPIYGAGPENPYLTEAIDACATRRNRRVFDLLLGRGPRGARLPAALLGAELSLAA